MLIIARSRAHWHGSQDCSAMSGHSSAIAELLQWSLRSRITVQNGPAEILLLNGFFVVVFKPRRVGCSYARRLGSPNIAKPERSLAQA